MMYKRVVEEDIMANSRERILAAADMASQRLLQSRKWQDVMTVVLNDLRRAARVNMVTLFNVNNPPFPLPARWQECLRTGQTVCAITADLPDDERALLRGVVSMALVPLMVDGRWWGCLAFEDETAARIWTAAECEALKSAAATLALAIASRHNHLTTWSTPVIPLTGGIVVVPSDGRINIADMVQTLRELAEGCQARAIILHLRENPLVEPLMAAVRAAIAQGVRVIIAGDATMPNVETVNDLQTAFVTALMATPS